ncbi:hypothetical protein MANES_06G078132v8 [Manihot esculenta]|uniref:Uncharacterized protein n=1 Tax=Manihot esculenta TaxID=3983 RepID=A0ACB7HI68_MANES|nr:hypothetical protein MANES_06G078132v8 [Manihot esculenta]
MSILEHSIRPQTIIGYFWRKGLVTIIQFFLVLSKECVEPATSE